MYIFFSATSMRSAHNLSMYKARGVCSPLPIIQRRKHLCCAPVCPFL